MLILVYARIKIEVEEIDNYSIYSMRHPLYSFAKPSGGDGNFTIELIDQLQMMNEMTPFMGYVDYLNLNGTIQVPVVDTLSIFGLGSLDDDVDGLVD
jgi:hypothetical protein